MKRKMTHLAPVHPGEILREEFLAPLGVSPYAVAKAAGVPRTRIERIVREETSVSADTALRLGLVFDTSPEFWMNLQARYDLETAATRLGKKADKIEPIRPQAA